LATSMGLHSDPRSQSCPADDLVHRHFTSTVPNLYLGAWFYFSGILNMNDGLLREGTMYAIVQVEG
jgi:hypothetical protein